MSFLILFGELKIRTVPFLVALLFELGIWRCRFRFLCRLLGFGLHMTGLFPLLRFDVVVNCMKSRSPLRLGVDWRIFSFGGFD